MITTNPYTELSVHVSSTIMQTYVVAMILCVAGGTLFDIFHKKSARYFLQNWRKVRDEGDKELGRSEIVSLAVKTLLVEGLTSAEFCNASRRIAHLLGMHGFLVYAITTFIMVFWYPNNSTPTPAILPLLWYIGGLLVCVGGYWFWFFIRVDVAAEGNSPFRIVHADLFILSLIASNTFGLVWAILQGWGSSWSIIFLTLYLVATTVLFGSVPWSKFSHMFYKPAAALQKRVEEANGTRRNLPAPANEPETFGTARGLPRNF
ncbi:MAG: adenylyl-sulfate reductase [Dehalococcoidia bacterium]|nr:adenylyl-sulfate reductase [Dehalococcoidia bacterium]